MESLTVTGSTVKAGFRVSCPKKRSCTLLPNVSKDLMEEEVFTALRKMKAIGGGTISYRCRPEESILCEYVWDLEDNVGTFLFFPFSPLRIPLRNWPA
jgi:hypothetical protein